MFFFENYYLVVSARIFLYPFKIHKKGLILTPYTLNVELHIKNTMSG